MPAVQRGRVPAPEDEGANPGLEFEPFLVWQRGKFACASQEIGNRKLSIWPDSEGCCQVWGAVPALQCGRVPAPEDEGANPGASLPGAGP